MKKLILSALCLFPIGLMAQQAYTVKGKVGSLNAPAKAYLAYRAGTNNVTDSVNIVNGEFEFKGTIESPVQASIRVKHDAAPVNPDPKLRKPLDAIVFYLEKATIKLTAADSVKNAKITGSKINDDDAKLKALLKPINDQLTALMKEYNTFTKEQKNDEVFMKPFMDKYNPLNKEKEPINKKFAEENRDSYIGMLTYRTIMGYDFDPKVAEAEFMKYSAEVRATAAGKNIQNMIDGAKKTQVGIMADFTQNDANGKAVKLSDFKGKYVLVDFWASWCGPCRAENPNVVAAYNKYKDKNFTVLGVSLDGGTTKTTKEAWQKAIVDDGLTWTHVSDLNGWDNVVSKSFGVSAIPFNFLVDPTGKIVARNVRGEELQKKLADILDSKSK